MLVKDQILLGGLQRTGAESRAGESCDHAPGRQILENKLQEREPRCKRGPQKPQQPKREGRTTEESGHSRGTSEELVSDRAERDPICPHILLVLTKIMANKAHLETEPIFYNYK